MLLRCTSGKSILPLGSKGTDSSVFFRFVQTKAGEELWRDQHQAGSGGLNGVVQDD